MARTDHMQGWQNRIVGHGEEAPDQLLANPANWRIHPKGQQDALAGVLNEVGWVQDIIVNKRSGHVVDGHLRVSLAISRNEASVPVVYVDLDEREEALVLATIDPLSAMAATDKEQLDALLRDVATGEAAVQAMLGKLAQDAGIVKFDPMSEWDGMPAFEQEDKGSFRQIVVHFASQADVNAFADLIGQTLGEKTRSVWYPEVEKTNMLDIYADQS